ncbi:hypothetical protein AHAS_Ahas18G0118000 [Arachis hypogaea]
MRGIFDGGFSNTDGNAEEEYEAANGDWGEELDMPGEEDDGEGGWELEDLELPPAAETPKASTGTRSSVFVAPTPGMRVSQMWIQKSSLAADHAAAGNFDTAMSHSNLRDFSSVPERGGCESSSPNVRGPPALLFKPSQLDEKLKAGYKSTTAGKFTEALKTFTTLLNAMTVCYKAKNLATAANFVRRLLETNPTIGKPCQDSKASSGS